MKTHKKHHKKQEHSWLYKHRIIIGTAIIVILLYALVSAGMSLIESERSKQAEMNVLFLEALSIADTPKEKEHLLLLYHKLSKDDTSLLKQAIVGTSSFIDDITPGTEHCIDDDQNVTETQDCAFSNEETLSSLSQIEQRILRKQTFAQPKQLTFLDHAIKAITLLLEALIPASLVAYWRQIKKKIWK